MNMRLDYPLYGVAVVLFVAAALFALVADSLFYTVLLAVVGLVLIVGGFFLRPKVASTPAVQAPASPAPEPAPQAAAPVAEAPVATAPPAEPAPVFEAPKPEAAAQPTPVLPAPTAAPPAIAAPPVETALPSPTVAQTAPVEAAKSGFSQIRGISAARAEQLKTVGVTSIQELANANPEDLAAKLNVSPKIVKMWVGTAKKLAK